MENIITKLLEQIKDSFEFFYNKPWHFLFIGIAILFVYFYTNRNFYISGGVILIVFSVVTIIEFNVKRVKTINNIEQDYKNLQGLEKKIIDHCIENKILTYITDPLEDNEDIAAIYSLVGKGFGENITYGGDFIMHKVVYDHILKIKAKE